VCTGESLEEDLIALVRRRLVEAGRGAQMTLPLVCPAALCARPRDVSGFVSGELDLTRLSALGMAFQALHGRIRPPQTSAAADDVAPPLYAVFRLACLPWPLPRPGGTVTVRCDPAVVARLASGDIDGAGRLALTRLHAAGLHPALRHLSGDPALSRKLAASLAFPVSPGTASRLADGLLKKTLSNAI
jgi:CRISPR-associated protein Csx17